MTLFAYRFPLEIVFRILDVIFAEGSEAVLRFALALVKHNSEKICSLDFEKLLEYLKEGLFDMYVDNMNRLVQDASQITISKRKLDKWQQEYLEVLYKQSPEVLEAEEAKQESRKHLETIKKLERDYETLNREHVDLVNRYLHEKEVHDQLQERNEELTEKVNSYTLILQQDRKIAEDQVRSEMDELVKRNMELVKYNAALEETIHDLEQKLLSARNMLANSENEKEELKNKMEMLKTALN
jgi:DNA repair exonuclease SbcCD ATPase subunit